MKSTYAIAALALAFAGVGPGASVNAATDTIYRYSTPKTGYYTIDYMALSQISTSSVATFEKNIINGGMSLTGCLAAGINLPQGAKIKALRLWHDDNSTNASAKLQRRALGNGNVRDIVSAFLMAPGGTRTMETFPATAALATVDNLANSYSFHVCLDGNNFWSARIEYTYDTAGD